MKKIALTSLLAVFAVSGANAANIINGNPLYRPNANHFSSETGVSTDTDYNYFTLGENLAYGITDKLAVTMEAAGSYDSSDYASDKYSFDDMGFGLNFRYLDAGNIKGDIYGKGLQVYDTSTDLETIWYRWTAGTKVGYTTDAFTIAGKAEVSYLTDDVDAYDFEETDMTVGVEGQYVVDSSLNLVAGLDYVFALSDEDFFVGNNGQMNARIGANYNIDETKYVGIYATKNLRDYEGSDNENYGMGAKFGIDF